MGKQLKKGRPPPCGKQFSRKVTTQSAETDEVVTVMEQRRSCVHFEKCVDMDRLLEKMKACEQIKCGECKEGLHMKRRCEGKVNRFSFNAKKAIWLCLECGQYICAGDGLPTDAQSHVMRHFRLTRHPIVIQCEYTCLRWCFSCQSLLPFEKEENGEKIDLLLEAVKLIKERSSSTYSDKTEAEDSYSSSISAEIKGYAVRGLVNLGNTCFFNSVLQNLLSLDQLRDRLLKEDLCCDGPLVSSLKELITEATSEANLFNRVIYPSALFGVLCSKAPQFRGFQQHDSHELLRCLLDGLSIEESSLRKKLDASDDSEKPTLVDSVFGGEVSSTISCLECGHSSKVYEPFLDLSLPVPSKKPPPSKKQTFSQRERFKFPPTNVFKNVADSKDSSEPVSAMTLDNKQVPEIATQDDTEEVDSFWFEAFGETDLVSQGDVSDTASLTQPEVADQTFVGSTETLVHGVQCSNDTASSGISAEISDAQVWGYPDFSQNYSSTNPFADEEIPLLVADSQVLSMPCKDDKTVSEDKGEASLSDVSGHHEKKVDYDDIIIWCFDEPDVLCDEKTVKEREGEVSSSLVSSLHEQTVDNVDLNESDVSRNDKTVRERESEVTSSLMSSHHGKTIDYVILNEPDVPCNDKTVRECESEAPLSVVSEVLPMFCKDDKAVSEDKGEASLSDVSGQHEKTVDYDDFFSWCLDEPNVFCNDETVEECVSEAPSSFVSSHREQKIDSAGSHRLFEKPEVFEGPLFGPPTKAKVYKAGFMDIRSNFDAEVLDDSDSPVSVESCLALFTKPEILSKDNAWHCENCSNNLKLQRLREKRDRFGYGWMNENGFDEFNDDLFNHFINLKTMYDGDAVDSEEVIVRSPASKRVLVNKAPPVLTIHLKRFSQDALGRLSKLSGHIGFNEFIDLGLYMDMDSRGTEEEEDQPVYMLAGIVEHSGTMGRGHYVAYIRGDHDEKRDSYIWYRASDSFVRQVSFEEVLRSEAYILFYQRI
ncbi:unnamed protein product [Eruca vesicaria subsp. sativa]|uniref:Ubiquitin carboxyl-terminal hydrolase n=1 Tax=Eruca vesicaria subsp. sativa TaxID=29727 RepID=A0ABC8LBJ0_ERUVS|nr:unnamed protein product [Eruca vesicaria subsp. sativa]